MLKQCGYIVFYLWNFYYCKTKITGFGKNVYTAYFGIELKSWTSQTICELNAKKNRDDNGFNGKESNNRLKSELSYTTDST